LQSFARTSNWRSGRLQLIHATPKVPGTFKSIAFDAERKARQLSVETPNYDREYLLKTLWEWGA
jgi:hypothetical protein